MSEKCELCGKKIGVNGSITMNFSDSSITYCIDCSNADMSLFLGLEDHSDYPRNLIVKGYDRKMHTFSITKMIFPDIVSWEAAEIKNGVRDGYEFKIYAKTTDDPQKSFEKLRNIVEKGVKKRYLTSTGSLKKNDLIGQISWRRNEYGGSMGISVDGKWYPMEQLIKILETHEGWFFKLDIFSGFEDDEKKKSRK